MLKWFPNSILCLFLLVFTCIISQLNLKCVAFSCTNGNNLTGAPQITCLPSGHWSHPIPACLDALCPSPLDNDGPSILQVSGKRFFDSLGPISNAVFVQTRVESYSVGGRVFFSCLSGYRLVGASNATCLTNNMWSLTKSPECMPIKCPFATEPKYGYITKVSSRWSSIFMLNNAIDSSSLISVCIRRLQ